MDERVRLTRSNQPNSRTQPLFIYLPGMDGTGELFHTQAREIGRKFDLRCVKIPPQSLLSWADLTKQTLELIKAEISGDNVTRAIYLCGESFGGCLALQMAMAAPELFDRLILVNPALSLSRQPLLGVGGQIGNLIPDFVYQLSTLGFLPFLAALERYDWRDRFKLLAAMNTVPKDTSIWRLSMLQSFDLDRLVLDKITQTVLLVASGADRLLPSVTDARSLLAKLPQGQLVVLPDSGHACLLEMDVSLDRIMLDYDRGLVIRNRAFF